MNSISDTYKILQSGISLPLAIIFTIVSTGYLYSFLLTIYEADWISEFKIAKTRASLNADAGIALGAYRNIFKRIFPPEDESNLTITEENNPFRIVVSTEGEIEGNMGSYKVRMYETEDENAQLIRTCTSKGIASVRKHILGNREIKINKENTPKKELKTEKK